VLGAMCRCGPARPMGEKPASWSGASADERTVKKQRAEFGFYGKKRAFFSKPKPARMQLVFGRRRHLLQPLQFTFDIGLRQLDQFGVMLRVLVGGEAETGFRRHEVGHRQRRIP